MPPRALYDVNLLIALYDPLHARHDDAHKWHRTHGAKGWASCPLTQNGLMRIMSQPRYANPQPLAQLVHAVREFSGDATHQFWPDDISLASVGVLHDGAIMTAGALTDLYLLALAVRHSGRLITLDSRIRHTAVFGATAEHLVML
ncbi:MAG: VapC toxin family PIN domain ribonuclease [Burkholderiales bacterium]|nr:VapC toxin family PIN domain ribonuclease [Burkholderiales bacterium]